MLAEIFFLRLETMVRASEQAAQAKNSRFVPLPGDAFPGLRGRQARENGRSTAQSA
jgi:hypothetical protein